MRTLYTEIDSKKLLEEEKYIVARDNNLKFIDRNKSHYILLCYLE